MPIDTISSHSSLPNLTSLTSGKRTVSGQGRNSEASPAPSLLKEQRLESYQESVRPEVIAHGKELLKDPGYPSQAVINRMAELIAQGLR